MNLIEKAQIFDVDDNFAEQLSEFTDVIEIFPDEKHKSDAFEKAYSLLGFLFKSRLYNEK